MPNCLSLIHISIDGARETAARIADQLHTWINRYTTTTIERAVARLLGVDGVDAAGVPLPNVLVDRLHENGLLGHGLLQWLARAMLATGRSAPEIAAAVADGQLDVASIPMLPEEKWREPGDRLAVEAAAKITARRREREQMMAAAAPVSYTHLDVYKRQRQYRSSQKSLLLRKYTSHYRSKQFTSKALNSRVSPPFFHLFLLPVLCWNK